MSKVIAQPLKDVLIFVFQTTAILDERAVKEVGHELNQAVDLTTHEKIVVDLGRVDIMTSAMIGELVKFKKRCDTDKVQLRVCGLSKNIAEVFKITRMDKIFKIHPTREKALKSFGSWFS